MRLFCVAKDIVLGDEAVELSCRWSDGLHTRICRTV